jgi:hypothetical protein
MRWRVILAGGAILLMLVLQLRQPGAAYACLCQSPSLEAEFDSADAVFQGEVVTIERLNDYQESITFKVSKAWKGSYQTMVVVQETYGGSCLYYRFVKGSEYIVFANKTSLLKNAPTLSVPTCGFTDLASAEMLAELRLISRPQPTLAAAPPPDAGAFPWGWLALGLGLSTAGIWRWRRARRPI